MCKKDGVHVSVFLRLRKGESFRACELQEETKRVRMRECAYMFACANEKENAFVRDRAHACVCMCVREKERKRKKVRARMRKKE